MKSPAILQLEAAFVAEIEAICAARTREIVTSSLERFAPKKRRGRPPKLRVVR